jgi:hypothetical protein
MGVHVSQPHDAQEREADRAADAVLAGKAVVLSGSAGSASIHRACSECEQAARDQLEQDGTIQTKREGDTAGAAGTQPETSGALEGHGQPLPRTLRDKFEPRFAP